MVWLLAESLQPGKPERSVTESCDSEIILEIPQYPASRKRSWLDMRQVEEEHWEVVDKIADIIFDEKGKWHPMSVSFARNVLEFLNDHEFISWKQYDSIMSMKTAAEYKKLYGNRQQVQRISHKNGYTTIVSGKRTITFHGKIGVIKADSPEGLAFKYASTDRQFDNLHRMIWGVMPQPDPESGYIYKYRDDGSRYEAIPDDNDMDDLWSEATELD